MESVTESHHEKAKQSSEKECDYSSFSEHTDTNWSNGNELKISANSNDISSLITNEKSISSPSNTSINTSILDDDYKNAKKQKSVAAEEKIKSLQKENEKILSELQTEKSRNEKLEKKLKFVKDNQEVFMRLKEAYINMKYNEAAGKKLIEIREKGLQTWDGILCRGCIEAEEVRRATEKARKRFANSFIISTENMEQLEVTIKYLRDLISKRERSWSLNMEHERKMQSQLETLKTENEKLRNFIKNNANKETVIDIPDEKLLKENAELRKIIVKFEKRFQEIIKKSGRKHSEIYPHNEKECKIIDQLMNKYEKKLRRNKSCRRLKRSHSFHESSSKKSLSNTKLENLRAGRSSNAILAVDSLFDSESSA